MASTLYKITSCVQTEIVCRAQPFDGGNKQLIIVMDKFETLVEIQGDSW